MKNAIVIDFSSYQKQDDTLSKEQSKGEMPISEELVLAIQSLIERLRKGPIRQTS